MMNEKIQKQTLSLIFSFIFCLTTPGLRQDVCGKSLAIVVDNFNFLFRFANATQHRNIRSALLLIRFTESQ